MLGSALQKRNSILSHSQISKHMADIRRNYAIADVITWKNEYPSQTKENQFTCSNHRYRILSDIICVASESEFLHASNIYEISDFNILVVLL